MLARRSDCSAGRATFTTVPSIKAMLEPSMVAARIQGPLVIPGRSHAPARIAASSQGGLAMVAIAHCPPPANGPHRPVVRGFCVGPGGGPAQAGQRITSWLLKII